MKYLSENLKYISNLKKIDIGDNEIGEEGIISFSSNLKYISNLSGLGIAGI